MITFFGGGSQISCLKVDGIMVYGIKLDQEETTHFFITSQKTKLEVHG